MRRLLLLAFACTHAATAPVDNHATAIAPAAPLPGARATIVHKFLHAPISVVNPTNAALDVATATGSVMLVTIQLDSVSMMLAADGSTAADLGPLPAATAIVDHGNDGVVMWRVREAGGQLEVDALNLATGVYCSIYKPEVHTRQLADRVLAACRDIRPATPAELADTAHVYRG